MTTHPRSGEYFAPAPLAALALLVTNDCWLKARFHNAVTGKISDIAVCFLMPLFVSEILGLSVGLHPRTRLAVGAIVTTVLFTVLEVVPAAARSAVIVLERLGPLLGIPGRFRMTADPTDLACLVFVPISLWYGVQRLSPEQGAPGRMRPTRARPHVYVAPRRRTATSSTT